MRLSLCFGTLTLFKFLIFIPKFFYCPPMNFLIFCNRMDVQKIPKGPPLTFFGTMRLPGNFKFFSKNSEIFFSSIFSFLRAFVVSSRRKSGFRVLLSLRYGADLCRSWLVVIELFKFLLKKKTFLAKKLSH